MAAELTAGQALTHGRYVVEELIGEGGMATVYRARDTALDRTVAVKTMSASLAGDASARERFRREARAVARMAHPHVVDDALWGTRSGDGRHRPTTTGVIGVGIGPSRPTGVLLGARDPAPHSGSGSRCSQSNRVVAL